MGRKIIATKYGKMYINNFFEDENIKEFIKKYKDKNMEKKFNPPIGLIPKKHHDHNTKFKRFNEVCGAISRYYTAGLQIDIEWVEEYNELVEYFQNI